MSLEELTGVQIVQKISSIETRVRNIKAEIETLERAVQEEMVKEDRYPQHIAEKLWTLNNELETQVEVQKKLLKRLEYFENQRPRIKQIKNELEAFDKEAEELHSEIDQHRKKVRSILEKLKELRNKHYVLWNEYEYIHLDPERKDAPKLKFLLRDLPSGVHDFVEG